MSEDTKLPSAVRLQRIEGLVSDDKKLREKLSKEKTLELVNRRGKKLKFAPEIGVIASKLQEAGHDPASCKKALIISAANSVLFGTESPAAAVSALAVSDEAAPSEGTPAPPAEDASATGPKLGDPGHSPFLACLNLMLATRQLLAFDKADGEAKRKTSVEALIREFQLGI